MTEIETDFEGIIEECKSNSYEIDNIDLRALPDTSGVVAIFKNGTNIVFEENNIYENGPDIFTLDSYQVSNPIDILYIAFEKSISKSCNNLFNSESKKAKHSKIIFSKIKDNRHLKFGFFSTDEKINMTDFMSFIIKKYKAKPIMNKIFRSNDAIPSWSGFNFQGFVTILRTLQLMNEKMRTDYENFSVELERYEDFIIYEGEDAKELFQVKAYAAEMKVAIYVEAIQKLILHRNQVESPDATCYIATAERIIGWDESEYRDTINRYGYNGKLHVAMKDVIAHIFDELKTYYRITDENEKNTNLLELGFSSLGRFISEKIISLHKNKVDEDYRISFKAIAELLDNASKSVDEGNSYYTRVKVDQVVFETIDAKLFNYCDECDQANCENCPIIHFREAFESVDHSEYAQIIVAKPFHDKDKIYEAVTFNPNDLSDIFEDFYHTDSENFFYDNQHIFITNNTGKDIYMGKIIPTAIQINDPRNTGKGLTKLLERIQNNPDLHPVFNNSSLTTTMKEKLINYKEQQVTFVKDELLDADINSTSNLRVFPDFDFNLINREFYRKDMEQNE